MKQRIFGILFTMAIVAIVIAAGVAVATQSSTSSSIVSATGAQPYTKPMTLLSSAATTTTTAGLGTTTGTIYTLGVPMSNFSCQVLYSSATLSTSTMILEGSIDGTNYRTLSSTTGVATANYFDSTGKWAVYLRPNWSVYTSETGTVAATMRCIGQQ